MKPDIDKAERAKNILMRVFFTGAFIVFTWLFAAGVCGFSTPLFQWAPIALLFAAFSFGAAALMRHIDFTDKKLLIFGVIAGAVIAAGQALVIFFLSVEPSWDFGAVFQSAYEFVTTGEISTYAGYFDRFSNNTGLLIWEIGLFRAIAPLGLTGRESCRLAGEICNAAAIDAAILFAVLFCRRVWGNQKAGMVLLLSALFTPYYLYAPIFYTDSIGMMFVTMSLYLFFRYIRQKKKWPRILLLGATAVSLALGMKVKGSIAILLVAMVLWVIFQYKWRRTLAVVLAMAVAFFGSSALFEIQVNRMGIVSPEGDEKHGFPTEYWIYMGLNKNGGFNQDDFEYIYGLETKTDRKQAAREGIAQRVAEYGPAGMAAHLTRKASFTYRDGTYYSLVQLSREPLRESSILPYFTANDEHARAYVAIAAGYHGFILISLLAGLIYCNVKKRRFGMTALLYVALFGLALFLLIWETRSRYLMNFTPIMLILAGNAMSDFSRLSLEWLKERKERKAAENSGTAEGAPEED